MRYRHKSYWRIPAGEIQIGHLSRSVVMWWRGRRYIVKSGRRDDR